MMPTPMIGNGDDYACGHIHSGQSNRKTLKSDVLATPLGCFEHRAAVCVLLSLYE